MPIAAGCGSETTDGQCPRVYIGLLRQELEKDPGVPRLVLTASGVGYRPAGSK